ncbi:MULTISPECIES: SDR family oxidoreductase [Exiguobacterium]|uniref:SDR family oxidoreductase n=1 Tax=Exiguobacterium antarcticum TaxID=132920 RepID=A0ABT6R485_9BACL|nr:MULTISPECIES: SDR family oxidoreductase [Exiguobacterium]MCT4780863.1 SDR family oxidoreductase [Exiguobacterium soli]MDI3235759.1 SDR family oxidoreductase [Exiguobacterium antarcticum]
MRLSEKVIIVTGAASGMGKAMAELFAAEGARVIVSDIHKEAAVEVAEAITNNGGTAHAVETNVADEAAVRQLLDETLATYGTLDILVNNAGIMDGMEGVGDVTDERWERVFAVNTTAVMRLMRLSIPVFQEQGHGVILNNISIGGLNGARAGAAYTASKHAVVGLTKNTAYLYAKEGIRCNGIAPGAVETNIGQSMTNINEFGMGRTMLGMGLNPRTAQPEEIAKLALFLVSEDSSFVNGAIVVADGGWSAY